MCIRDRTNKHYCDIIWPKELAQSNGPVIKQIESELEENNMTSTRYPSDLTHALLCKHATSSEFERKGQADEKKEENVRVVKKGDPVKLNGHKKFNKANEWVILEVYDVSTGIIGEGKTFDGNLNRVQLCLGVLYVNKRHKQLVLAHKNIEADWKSLFSPVGGLSATIELSLIHI